MNWSIFSKVHLRYSLITQKNVCDFKTTLGSTHFASMFLDPPGWRERMSSVKHIVNDTFSRNGAIFGAGESRVIFGLLTDGQSNMEVEIVF